MFLARGKREIIRNLVSKIYRKKLLVRLILMSEDNVTLSTQWKQLVEVLRYKAKERGFGSRWYHCNFFDATPPASLWPLDRLSLLGLKAAGA